MLYVQLGTRSFAGIERVVDSVCAELAKTYPSEFDVDVLIVSKHENYPPEPHAYNVVRKSGMSKLGLIGAYRSTVRSKKYDLVVVPQIETTVIFWFAQIGLSQRIALHLHGNPRRENTHIKARILFFLFRYLVMPRIAAVFGTSPRQLQSFAADFGCDKTMVWVPNPVRSFEPPAPNDNPVFGIITFVNVGRFDYQKGQEILIDAFCELHAIRRNSRLRLVGYGKDEKALAEQIDRLGLSGIVTLESHPDNPKHALYGSDVFVATSRWEGWSLAICEALRCGLPVISTDCEFGPSDILVDLRLGRLVPQDDMAALVNVMTYYCDNIAEERSHSDFRRRNIDQYSVENIVKVHAAAIKNAAA
ncbi:MAG: glycosyltransferase [Methylobacterium radiotolerans]